MSEIESIKDASSHTLKLYTSSHARFSYCCKYSTDENRKKDENSNTSRQEPEQHLSLLQRSVSETLWP